MHALWSLIGGRAITPAFASRLLTQHDAQVRAWGVRAIGNLHASHQDLANQCAALANDSEPVVQMQVAIAAAKLEPIDPLPVWITILATCGDDPLLPHIVWQNIHPRLPEDAERLLELVEAVDLEKAPGLAAMLPKVAEKLQD